MSRACSSFSPVAVVNIHGALDLNGASGSESAAGSTVSAAASMLAASGTSGPEGSPGCAAASDDFDDSDTGSTFVFAETSGDPAAPAHRGPGCATHGAPSGADAAHPHPVVMENVNGQDSNGNVTVLQDGCFRFRCKAPSPGLVAKASMGRPAAQPPIPCSFTAGGSCTSSAQAAKPRGTCKSSGLSRYGP